MVSQTTFTASKKFLDIILGKTHRIGKIATEREVRRRRRGEDAAATVFGMGKPFARKVARLTVSEKNVHGILAFLVATF